MCIIHWLKENKQTNKKVEIEKTYGPKPHKIRRRRRSHIQAVKEAVSKEKIEVFVVVESNTITNPVNEKTSHSALNLEAKLPSSIVTIFVYTDFVSKSTKKFLISRRYGKGQLCWIGSRKNKQSMAIWKKQSQLTRTPIKYEALRCLIHDVCEWRQVIPSDIENKFHVTHVNQNL